MYGQSRTGRDRYITTGITVTRMFDFQRKDFAWQDKFPEQFKTVW
jgi:hypothetical protein